jgi:hypothetical protein
MYPSGAWQGYWEQAGLGRQPMARFELHFQGAAVTGSGTDIVGRFVMSGNYDTQTGRIQLCKHYLGRHEVIYEGHPDGEGCIGGTWRIEPYWSGKFLMQPVMPQITGSEPIQEIP